MIINLIKSITGFLCLVLLFRVSLFAALNWEKKPIEIVVASVPELTLIVILLGVSMVCDTYLENKKNKKI